MYKTWAVFVFVQGSCGFSCQTIYLVSRQSLCWANTSDFVMLFDSVLSSFFFFLLHGFNAVLLKVWLQTYGCTVAICGGGERSGKMFM